MSKVFVHVPGDAPRLDPHRDNYQVKRSNISEVINTFSQVVPTGLITANFQNGSALWPEVGESVTTS